MQTQMLGTSGLEVTRIGYGCMLLGGAWDETPLADEVRKAAAASIEAALAEEINFFDHADIYTRGKSERVFGEYLKAHPRLRDRIYIQTKCGIRPAGSGDPKSPGRYDFSYEHIVRSAEGSLKRLQTDYLDVLLLHRPDVLAEPQEVARAFDDLHKAGKVRFFGVSNHTAAQIALLRKCVVQPIVANQVELNLLHMDMIDAGIHWNLRGLTHTATGDGTLEYCRLHDITLQSWSPLIRGMLSGSSIRPDDPRSDRAEAAAPIVAEMASQKGLSVEGLLIAWLLRHPAGIQPIVGTRNPQRLAAACKGLSVSLTREEWYTLYVAGRGRALP